MDFIERMASAMRVAEIEATAKEFIGSVSSPIGNDQGHSDRF